jgi:hypothetical protein
MAFIAAAILGAGAIGAGASIYASSVQSKSAQNAINAQQGMFNTALTNEQPYINAGQSGIAPLQGTLNTLQGLTTPGPNQTAMLSQLPGFQFASDWGQRGVANQGTTTGLGGNTLTAGANFATGLTSQNWGTLIQQLQGTAQQQQNFVNTGANTAANVGTQAVGTGQGIASSTIGQGNAQAAGILGAGSNIGNSLTTSALLQKLTGGNMYGTGNIGGTGGSLGGLY